jgi:short-subunit dehydrogenase
MANMLAFVTGASSGIGYELVLSCCCVQLEGYV